MPIAIILASILWSLAALAQEPDMPATTPGGAITDGAIKTEQQPPPTDSKAENSIDLETILNNPLTEEDYRESKHCLWMRSIDRVEVLSDSLVLFRGRRRDEIWLNQLASRCAGLNPDMVIELRAHGSSLCRSDRLRGHTRLGFPGIAAECRLGDFEPIDKLQADALRTAIDEQRKADRMARKTRRANKRSKK